MSGGEAGDRASSDPQGRERAAAAETSKHHLLPSGSRRELQPQVGGRGPGAELPREDPPTLHGRGSHRRRARNRRHRARRSWEPRRPGSYPPGRHHQATFPPRVEQSFTVRWLALSVSPGCIFIPLISV